MFALLISVAVLGAGSSAPSVSVVVVGRQTIAPAAATQLAMSVAEGLNAAGLTVTTTVQDVNRELARMGIKDSASCASARPCAWDLGQKLRARVLVAVSTSEFMGDRSAALEAIDVESGAVLAEDTVLVAAKTKLDWRLLSPFASAVNKALAPPVPAPVAVAPPEATAPVVAPTLEPAATTTQEVVPAVVESKSKVPSVVLASVGAAGVVTGLVLVVVGAVMARSASSIEPTCPVAGKECSTQSFPAASSQMGTANALFVASGIAGGVGLVLGGTAVALW